MKTAEQFSTELYVEMIRRGDARLQMDDGMLVVFIFCLWKPKAVQSWGRKSEQSLNTCSLFKASLPRCSTTVLTHGCSYLYNPWQKKRMESPLSEDGHSAVSFFFFLEM